MHCHIHIAINGQYGKSSEICIPSRPSESPAISLLEPLVDLINCGLGQPEALTDFLGTRPLSLPVYKCGKVRTFGFSLWLPKRVLLAEKCVCVCVCLCVCVRERKIGGEKSASRRLCLLSRCLVCFYKWAQQI